MKAENAGMIDLGESLGFAQVDVVTEAVLPPKTEPKVPPQTAEPHNVAMDAVDAANEKESKLLEQVGSLVTDAEIGETPANAVRMVEVAVYDADHPKQPLVTRFMSGVEKLDDDKVHELAEVVEDNEFQGARWVATEILAQWKNGDRKVVIMAKRLR